jgi:hypothetical protein
MESTAELNVKTSHGCGVPTETTPLDPGGTPRSWIEAEEEDEEVSRIARLVVLALFTVLTISVTSVTASLLLVTSQIMHVAQSPRWTFYAITGMQFVTASLCGFLASYDSNFDKRFGISNTVYFRIIITSLLKVCCAAALAFLLNDYAQVVLAFVVCFLADAVLFTAVQFMAVLDPTSTAYVVLASYASNAVPIATVGALHLNTAERWSGTARLALFSFPMALNLLCIGIFAVAWPRSERLELPQQAGLLRRLSRGLSTGIRRLSISSQESLERGRKDDEVWSSSFAKLTLLAPSPFNYMTVLGMINGFTGLLVLPLIVLAKDSREQASLITGRLWGEVFGQSLATALLLTGAIKARVTDLICMVLLTIVRTALGFYCVHLLIKGELEFFLMFFFRAMDQFIMGSTPVMAVQAAETKDRGTVARNDLFWRNFFSLLGLVACAPILANTAPRSFELHEGF